MRGFFFTLASFIVLLYVSLIASLQTTALMEIGKSYSEIGDVYAFTLFARSFGEESVGRMVASLAYYALNRMAEHSVEHPLLPAGEDGTAYAKEALLSLMRKGESRHFTRPLIYNESERGATIEGMVERYNEILASTPYRVEGMDVEVENLSFIDALHLNLSATLYVNITSPKGGIAYSTHTTVVVPLKGLPDPMVNRFSRGFREVWPYEGDAVPPVPLQIGAGDVGQGWFYGPVVDVDGAPSIEEGKRWKYALAGSLDEITAVEGWERFGAYVVLGGLEHEDVDMDGCIEELNTFNPNDPEGGGCTPSLGEPRTEKPYVVVRRLPNLPVEGYFHQRVVFFTSDAPVGSGHFLEKKEAALYDIEDVRDVVNCQAYLPSNRSLPAPNFFQRMLERPWEYQDDTYGIFSFLVGEEFEDGYPAVDFLYAQALEGGCGETVFVKGLAGAKSPEMLEKSTMVNKFALPDYVLAELNWEALEGPPACGGGEGERAE